jgi:hypothetical protein|tara:strand:- start:264 stop:1013 length:750 start_codon:yes stop_codon:yes gene_type:complete
MKNILYFDLEHGSQTIGSNKDINKLFGFPELEPSTFGEFQDIIKQLYAPKKVESRVKIGDLEVKQTTRKVVPKSNTRIDGIVIDTVSELSKKYQRSLINQEGMMQMKDWGKLKNTIDKLMDMLTTLPGILICNCHSKIQHMDDGGSKLVPYIDGSSKEDISKWFDFVFYCKAKTNLKGETEYLWRTARTEKYDNAKDRTQLLDPEIPQDYQLVFNAVEEKGWDGAKILVIGSPGAGKTYSLKTINKEAK